MKGLKFIKFWLFIGCLQACVVMFLSVIPAPESMPGAIGLDKLIHFSVYAFIMFWFGLCRLPLRIYRPVGLGLISMGIILEIIQGQTGYRSMSYYDMTANTLGVSLGWILAKTRISLALAYFENLLSGK